VFVFALSIIAACTDTESRTDLNPEGPPMIRQVRLTERIFDMMSPGGRTAKIFAFGTHELADPAEVRESTSAAALDGSAAHKLRVIMDELLVGNHIEEVACRANVDSDRLTRVPLGATPDDIARCAAADDVLPATCPGSNPLSICICQIEAGCPRTTPAGTVTIANGAPVGILDDDQDGAADETRMIPGQVAIKCGASGQIDVPLNLDSSYWNPSGDQNKPAMGGFDALGPALVLTVGGNNALPTNVDCQLAFSTEIVDKQGLGVCAPANGDIEAGCTPGNLDAFKFHVEPIRVINLLDFDGNGTPDVPVDVAAPFDLGTNVPMQASSLAGITVTPATPMTVALANARTIRLTPMTAWAAATMYTVTIPTAVTDTFMQPLPAVVTTTFSTN
jgi:hypothetical protein